MIIQDIVLADLVSWLHARGIRIERDDLFVLAPYGVTVSGDVGAKVSGGTNEG